MTFLNGITQLFDQFADAKRMAHLFSLSDHELAVRGLSRDDLRRHYIASRSGQ